LTAILVLSIIYNRSLLNSNNGTSYLLGYISGYAILFGIVFYFTREKEKE